MEATQNNIPQLRFPEFEEEWEKKKLGGIFKISAGGDIDKKNVSQEKNEEFKYPIYANAEKNKGFYAYSDIYKFDEEVVTVAGRGVNIGIAHERKEKFYPIVRLLVLQPKEKQSICFFKNTINNLNLFIESTGVPQLTSPQISSYKVSFPTLPEQQKIANFLTAIDKKLQALKKKKIFLEVYKKGVIQKIFSQELRFKDGDGKEFADWVNKELGELLDYEQPTKYLVNSTEYDNKYKTPVITAGKTFILGYTNEDEGIFEMDLPVIAFDDFTTATQFVDFKFKAKSSAMKILIAKKNVNIKFVFEAMQRIRFAIGGHGRHWISVFAQIPIKYPSSKEQTKIANFLSKIDDKINAVSEQIEQTKEYKKGLLQKMFCN